MDRRIKKYLLFLVGLGVLGLFILRWDIDLLSLRGIKYPHYIFIALLLTLFAPLVFALRTKYFLLVVGEVENSFKNLIKIEYVNFFLRGTIPAKLNVPAKAVLLNKMCNVKIRNGISITTFEYVLDASIFMLFGLIGVQFFFKDIRYISSGIRLISIVFLLCIIAFFSIPPTIFEKLHDRMQAINMTALKKIITSFLKVMKIIRDTWATLIFNEKIPHIISIVVLQWMIISLTVKVLFLSVEYSVPISWILVVSGSSLLVGGVSTIPGGLGVRDVAMVVLYGALGIPKEISIIVVLMDRLLSIILIAIGYIYSLEIGLNILLKNGFE